MERDTDNFFHEQLLFYPSLSIKNQRDEHNAKCICDMKQLWCHFRPVTFLRIQLLLSYRTLALLPDLFLNNENGTSICRIKIYIISHPTLKSSFRLEGVLGCAL